MSKLKQIRKLLDIMVYGSKRIASTIAYEKAIDVLRELAKPVQYTVEIKKLLIKEGPEILSYNAIHNGEIIEFDSDLSELKEEVLDQFQQAHRRLSLPPITINQITFIEI